MPVAPPENVVSSWPARGDCSNVLFGWECSGRPPLVVLGYHDHAGWRVEQGGGAAGGLVDVDPRRRGDPASSGVGSGAVVAPVADHDAASVEYHTLVLG